MQNEITLQTIIDTFSQRKATPIFKLSRFGILTLLTKRNGELCFVLNKRAEGIRQAGDICFPGGRQEKEESLEMTAIREAEEELGVPRGEIVILGKSDYMLTIHKGLLQPIIGYVEYEVLRASCPNPKEVAEIFTVPLNFFRTTEPEIHNMVWEAKVLDNFPYDRIQGGKSYPFTRAEIPELFYEYKGHTIWGFTAQVIQNIIYTLDHEN